MPVAQKSPGCEIGHGNADPHRAFAGRAGDRHQPAHALRDLIEAGALVIGAVLAEAGNTAIDEARIDLLQALIVDAELCLHVGPEVFDHDVGLLRQPLEHREPLGVLQVQRHRALVAVQILEVGAAARAARLFAPGVLQQRIDLDDIGAPVRELAHAGRPRADAGQIEHGKAGEGLGSAREGHFEGASYVRVWLADASRSCRTLRKCGCNHRGHSTLRRRQAALRPAGSCVVRSRSWVGCKCRDWACRALLRAGARHRPEVPGTTLPGGRNAISRDRIAG